MNEDKDYSLLRPFDLEAAKSGELFVFNDCGELLPRKFIAGPDIDGGVVVQDTDGRFQVSQSLPYNMAPLCWVEGKPVYKGDVLYWSHDGERVVASYVMAHQNGDVFLFFEGGSNDCVSGPSSARLQERSRVNWTPPKVNRRVNLRAWLIGGRLTWREEGSPVTSDALRVPLEDRVVTVEEPAE